MAERPRRLHVLVEGTTEMETWVFAARRQLAERRGKPSLAAAMDEQVRRAGGGVESINDGQETSPSRRLLRICPDYNKTFDGPVAIGDLGVDALRAQCPHADAWLRRLGV